MYIPQESNGYKYLILPSQVEEIIRGLSDYAMLYCDEEIKEINRQRKIDLDKEMYATRKHNKTEKQKQQNKGYIYVLECNNTYKVGFSKDVTKRMKQLDTRPFELILITKLYSDSALDIEQEVHKRLTKYRAKNEWYHNIDVSTIVKTINQVAEDFGCDIQS